jgi:aminopeptidase N
VLASALGCPHHFPSRRPDTTLTPPNPRNPLPPKVRHYINKAIAAALRPELEALVKANDAPPGAPFVFDAANSARRAAKNKALALLSCLEDEAVEKDLLKR